MCIGTTCVNNIKNTKKTWKKRTNIKESAFRMTFVDVPWWHKILTFLAAELPPMPPSETPWVGKVCPRLHERGMWRHKNSNLDRNVHDLEGFMWSQPSITVVISPNQFALKQANFLAGEHFHLVLFRWANISHHFTNKMFVTSSLLFSMFVRAKPVKVRTKHFTVHIKKT